MSLGGIPEALRNGHWPTLIAAWLHLTVSFMVWVLLGALMVAIGADLHLSPAQQSFLVALPLLTGAGLRIVAGWACDWWGAKSTGLAVLGLQLVALLWGWVGATSYLELLAVGALLGLGGASFAVALPIASRSYPPAHQGLVLGLVASGNIGTVFSLALAPRLDAIAGWHGVFALMAGPVLAALACFAVMVRQDRQPRMQRPAHLWWQALIHMMGQRGVYWLAALYGLTFGGFVGLASFLPLYFHEGYGLGQVLAGSVTAGCSLIGSVIRPAGGYLADRWGGLRMLAAVLSGIAGVVLAAGHAPSLFWAAGWFLLAVGLMGVGNGILFQIVAEWYPGEIGLASGLVGAAGSLGGFFIPVWFSGIRELTGSYGPGWVLLALLSALAALSIAFVDRQSSATTPESRKTAAFPVDT